MYHIYIYSKHVDPGLIERDHPLTPRYKKKAVQPAVSSNTAATCAAELLSWWEICVELIMSHPETFNELRPAATRNAQRCVPNADPQRKGPKWVSSSADGVDAFSPGRKKHPKEPYVLKGHVTSSHGPYWSTDGHGLDASPWGWQCETRHPLCATQSSDVVILTARAQMIFFISVPLGSDAFCKALKKQIITQFNCGNHASCTEPINSTRCSFSRGGEKN